MAKHFYSKMVPELEHLVRDGKASGVAERVADAAKLGQKLEEVLNSANHRWYLNKMDPDELRERKKRQEEFQKRYAK